MKLKLFSVLILLFFISISSQAQSLQDKSFDIEVDPIAYALNGFSVHGGYVTGPWRIDLGVFGLEYPDALNSSDAFESSFIGAGWKLDRFIKGSPDGFFAGIEGGIMRLNVTHQASDVERDRMHYSLGIRGGYRWNTGLGNLYVTPWLGLGFTLNPEDITVNGDVYESGVSQPFPTVHIGWVF